MSKSGQGNENAGMSMGQPSDISSYHWAVPWSLHGLSQGDPRGRTGLIPVGPLRPWDIPWARLHHLVPGVSDPTG